MGNQRGFVPVAALYIIVGLIGAATYLHEADMLGDPVQLKDRCGIAVSHADEINSKTKQCP